MENYSNVLFFILNLCLSIFFSDSSMEKNATIEIKDISFALHILILSNREFIIVRKLFRCIFFILAMVARSTESLESIFSSDFS